MSGSLKMFSHLVVVPTVTFDLVTQKPTIRWWWQPTRVRYLSFHSTSSSTENEVPAKSRISHTVCLLLLKSFMRLSGSPSFPSSDLAKISPHILLPERFALHLGTHLVSRYAHIQKAFITIEQLRWSRLPAAEGGGAKGHPHSFIRDGDDKRVVNVEVDTLSLVSTSNPCRRL